MSFDFEAFQHDAFLSGAFQSEVLAEYFAFQSCAFQYDAFQTDVCQTVAPEVVTTPGGVRRSKRRRLLEIDGQLIPFKSESEMLDYLDAIRVEKVEEAKEIAATVADKAVRGVSIEPPMVEVATVDFAASQALIDRVAQINRDIELAYLMKLRIEAEIDDEEALLLLL